MYIFDTEWPIQGKTSLFFNYITKLIRIFTFVI